MEVLEYQPGKGCIKELMCYEDEQGEEDRVDDDNDILDELYINTNTDIVEGKGIQRKGKKYLNQEVKLLRVILILTIVIIKTK